MQKLKGISSGQNKKSCNINHHESKKIGFTFFWIFCDFLRNLQESANCFNYWSYPFVIRPLRRTRCSQCGPRGGRPARALQFRRGRRRSWPGKGRRRVRGSPRTHLRVVSGRGGRRQGCAVVHRGDCRWSSCSGEPPGQRWAAAVQLAHRWSRGVPERWHGRGG
jgi:hypothetical protein